MMENILMIRIPEYEYCIPAVEDYSRGDPTAEDQDGQTLLHKYVLNPDFDVDVMQSIINRGAPLEHRNETGKTALLLAVLNRKKNAMQVLIENGADVHVKDDDENNALHYMAIPELNCHFEGVENFNFDDTYYMLERLLKEGVDVNAQDLIDDNTPLMWAASGKHLEIVKMLLAFGANVHLTNRLGETCLHSAVYNLEGEDDHSILSELVRNKACVNCCDRLSRSPLYYTLLPGIPNNTSFAKELIKNSALLYWYKKIEFHCTSPEDLEEDVDYVNFEGYVDLYYEEIDKMKRHILPGKSDEEKNKMERGILPIGSNLCEFAREGVTEDDMRHTPGIKDEVFKIILTESFPLYLDLILSKLGRRFLLEKGRSLYIFTIIENEVESLNSDTRTVKKVVHLNSDIVYEICCILKDIDIFNLLSTFQIQFI